MANFFGALEDCYSSLNIEEEFSGDDDVFLNFNPEEDDTDQEIVFTCELCNKSLKTERGFKRHMQLHSEKAAQSPEALHPLDPPTWKGLLEKSIKAILDEDLQCDEILNELRSCVVVSDIDSEQSLCHFTMIISMFASDPEKFYPRFMKAVMQLESICGLSKMSTTDVGLELANQVLAHFKLLKSTKIVGQSEEIPTLSAREVAIVVYIGGYVFGELYRRIRKSKSWSSHTNQQKLTLFKGGKVDSSEVENIDHYQLVRCRDRGGLWFISQDAINIFIQTEKTFKVKTQNFTNKIDYNEIVNAVRGMEEIQSAIANIEETSDVSVENELLQNFLEEIILQYVIVRANSYAKNELQKHKQKFNVSKSKALRTELKRSSADTN